MTRAEHIQALLEEYARQRATNEQDQRRRVAEAVAKVPKIAELRAESAALALNAMRSILDGRTEAERRDVARNMKRRGQAINAEIRALLKQNGFGADALDLRCRCPICRDTGYVGEAPARFCECFETRLRLRQYEDGTMAGVDQQNFEKFDAAVAPEENGQRTQLLQLRRLCEAYADQFPDFQKRNLLLTGGGGLGKTFLLNCVFERVTARGFSAVRITAFRMFEAMRQQHVGNDPGFTGFSDLIEAPLLLIDDLGSEPMMRNITVEYLFTLLNERMANRRHTVVATNLTPVQLRERYGERVASRLLDTGEGITARFTGKDLRR